MHVAIDDTYGPIDAQPTRYVTGARRTYVAVEFPDQQVEEVREGVRACLNEMPRLLGISPAEFHFVDIYNRKKVWENAPEGQNLRMFEFFAHMYRQYRWKVHVQTVDERTLADHKVTLFGKVDGIELNERDGQALFFLLVKLKNDLPRPPEKLTIRIDSGRRKSGSAFASAVFREWESQYDGRYASSDAEPLIQIADFLAFSINRSTHLQMKRHLTDIDVMFLELVSSMNIRSPDIVHSIGKRNNIMADLDAALEKDRAEKGLE
ncbi:hypothetical protein [Agrobacterium tumefaciens]|uniref:hypothetical protein n=1 Tax=Agrobacterium tumefaciens TaxID=358 RepID=UPI001BA7A94B